MAMEIAHRIESMGINLSNADIDRLRNAAEFLILSRERENILSHMPNNRQSG